MVFFILLATITIATGFYLTDVSKKPQPQVAAMTKRIIGIFPGATRVAIRVITLLAATMMTIIGLENIFRSIAND